MSVVLNAAIPNNAPKGSIVGHFNKAVKLIAQSDASHYFVVSHDGLRLMTNWIGTIAAGQYGITVATVGPQGTTASFTVGVVTPAVSPDGTAITGGTGTLTTSAGTWTFGGSVASGQWSILLNGSSARGGVGSKLEVANGGQLYAVGTDGNWYVWKSGGWSASTDPNAPKTLVMTFNPPLPLPTIFDNAPAGQVLTTVSVAYSDGSAAPSVTLSSSDPSFLTTKGMQVILARGLTAADDGTHNDTITASDGLGAVAQAHLFGGNGG